MALNIFSLFTRVSDQARSRLRPAAHFRAVIERERSRADRNGAALSLVAISELASRDARQSFGELVVYLSQRLRVTDDFGMLEDDRVGVVLPDADARGAWKVADDITAHMAARKSCVECEVFTYPGDFDARGREKHSTLESVSIQGDSGSRPARPMAEILCRSLPWWKRSLDFIVSAAALVLLSPVFGLIAAGIKLTSPGPVFFCQTRCGLGGRPFPLYKFRSMVADAEVLKVDLEEQNEVTGPVFKIKEDPRITPIGRWLRRLSLDELPQLWNVFRGDMSLVGPRPPIPAETLEYDGWHRRRLEITPGITCIWQVSGRSNVPFTEWVRMDIRYSQRVSMAEDFRILLKTAPAVLSGDGAT